MRMKFYFFALLVGAFCAASHGDGDYLNRLRIFSAPNWLSTEIENAKFPAPGERMISKESAARMFRDADLGAYIWQMPYREISSTSLNIDQSFRYGLLSMSPLVDNKPELAQGLIDFAYLPLTNQTAAAVDNSFYTVSPMFVGRWSTPGLYSWSGNVKTKPLKFTIDDWAVGLRGGQIIGETPSTDWAVRFRAVVSAAGLSVGDGDTDELIRAEILRQRGQMFDAFEEETGIDRADFLEKSSAAGGHHGRSPSLIDHMASDWFARQFDTMFTYVKPNSWEFPVYEKTETNKYHISGSSIRSAIISAIMVEHKGQEFEVGGVPVPDEQDFVYNGAKLNSPVSEYSLNYIPTYPSATAKAIYRINGKEKKNDSGWYLIGEKTMDYGRIEYYKRTWGEIIYFYLHRAEATAIDVDWKKVNHWRRTGAASIKSGFKNYSGTTAELEESPEMQYYIGYRKITSHKPKYDDELTISTNGVISAHKEVGTFDFRSAIESALFDMGLDALYGYPPGESSFDVGLRVSVDWETPTNWRDIVQIKAVLYPNDPDGVPQTTYYEGSDQMPNPENDPDGDGIPNDARPSDDPDDPNGSGGSPNEIEVGVTVDFNQNDSMGYYTFLNTEWSPASMMIRHKFKFTK